MVICVTCGHDVTWVERLGSGHGAASSCQLDFHHMNIPRCNRELPLSLFTHVLRRTAYNVVIAHAGPREEGSIGGNLWQADDARFFPMALTYIVRS